MDKIFNLKSDATFTEVESCINKEKKRVQKYGYIRLLRYLSYCDKTYRGEDNIVEKWVKKQPSISNISNFILRFGISAYIYAHNGFPSLYGIKCLKQGKRVWISIDEEDFDFEIHGDKI